MAKIKIDVYSHGFCVQAKTPAQAELVAKFSFRYVRWGFKWDFRSKRNVRVQMGVYAAATRDRSEVRYHRNCLPEFLEHLRNNGIREEGMDLTYHDPSKINWPQVDVNLADGWSLRPVQEKVKDFCFKRLNDKRTTLIGLPPGMGKTITMLGIAAEMKMRFVVILRPQYIERWIGAFKETWNLKDEEILTISGSGNLKGLFDLGLSNQLGNIKAIIISNKTFQNYLKDYEVYGKEFHVMGWNVEPQRYAEVLGARFVYVDEGHQDSHLNFKIALYTHCENMVTATGTLTPDDPFLKKMTFIQFPIETRFMISAEDNHIAANAIFYKFNNPNAIKHNTPQGYNHGEFEKSLMKSKLVLSNYFKLISDLINEGYVSTRKEGYKCLIFVYSIAMATELTKYLNITYPDLVVNRYCEDDDYENLMNADVCVSTVLSAGTAVDIPGLSCAILTQSLSSTQSNLQAIGRLRPMKDGHTPQFYWLVCEDFEKHIEYHEKKRKMFKDIVKSYQYFNTGRKL